ncbi:SGNH/GDSL hydrolase family protein [Plantibacter flavus]|uniref:SGNH/GDSL hydrolase family protein n=1 Tax=Plantibacter flavus TaxID=150123 RepID=UPI003F166871
MARPRLRKRWFAAFIAAAVAVTAVIAVSGLRADVQQTTVARADTGADVAVGPLVAFYGDSYTKGSAASSPSARWSSLVAKAEGWTEYNAGYPGLGFVRKRDQVGDVAGDVIAQHPEVLIVALGINDNFVWAGNEQAIQDAVLPEFQRLRDGLPNTRIVVVEPWWYTADRPESVERIIGWVHGAAEAIDADYISGASHWLDENPGAWISEDGLHPSDAGYAHLAQRMLEELDALSPALP